MRRSKHVPALSDVLAQLSAPGAFAARRSVPAEDLEIEVNGVGAIRFPITPRTFAKLRALARPSPFGLREQTLKDPRVRSSWELSRSKVKLSAPRWKPALAKHLRALQGDLGLSPDQELTPVFDKLLLYAQGEFFKPHQDSEKHDDMVATLVVVLPSAYEGGALTVEHRGEARVFRRLKSQDKALSLLAFYADCAHSIRPVTRGFRVALTYRLLLSRSITGAPKALPRVDLTETLVERVREHFSSPVPQGFGRSESAPPKRLLYFLDHEYTERSLAWDKLKNGDRLRVAALRTAAERLACDCHLVLADVQETWLCEDDYPRDRRGWPDWDSGSDEEEEHDASAYELIELQDEAIELHHWIDAEGEASEGLRSSVSAEEVYATTPTSELMPFRTKHEGFQGNYGNTVDRWYHRAAFVMWPRSHTFVLRAEVAPEWAVDQLLALPGRSSTELVSKVEALLPRWPYTARGDARLFSKITKLAKRLPDPELARRWLAPVGAHRIHTRTMQRDIVALVRMHGLSWAQALFPDWMADTDYQTPEWAPTLAALCEELVASQATACTQLAKWLVERALAGALRRAAATTKEQSRWLDLDQFEDQAEHLAHGFEAAAAAGELLAIDRAVTTLLEDASTLSTALLCQTLSNCMARSTALRAHLAGSALYRLVAKRLDAVGRTPLRSPDDLRISFALLCGCADCETLQSFLGSKRTEFDWPLSKERRRHVHRVIDDAHLPITHVTLRRGSPHVLQLRKEHSLFAREQVYRTRAKEVLEALSSLGQLAASRRARPRRST